MKNLNKSIKNKSFLKFFMFEKKINYHKNFNKQYKIILLLEIEEKL